MHKLSAYFLVTGLMLAQTPVLGPANFSGYTAASSATEQDWEQRFRKIPEASRIHDNLLKLAAHPHNVGSEAERKNAEWMLARYKEWGWDAHIERFDVLYPTPKVRVLEMVSPTRFKAKLDEPPIAEDPYTKEKGTQLPGYNIYSADGDVTGPLVYANYGMPEDYEELAKNNVSVKGAIVIARYGGGWRGLKPKLAYEHGAIGCLIYSDPADDGYGQGDVLPKGPMRPPDGIQRGSVADTTLYPGDPLTPGIASVPGAKRLAISEAQTLMHIPVMPISYGDAQPLLAALEGRSAPASWRGGLPLTYHFGPGPAKVHLKLAFNWDQKPVLDVIATMRGSEEPDVWLIRGNHCDGWVNGAEDPISGQSSTLEEARALGELVKQGWRPKRTLIYAAWDGEEPGLIGSTEWGEAHAEDLAKHAAMYLNTDDSGRGFLFAGGSHSLEQLVNDVAGQVVDPETGVSVWKRQQAALMISGRDGNVEKRATLPLEPIGSGSDFAVFLDHLGIASLNLGFGGEDKGGTYHSAYDTPWFQDHFGDRDRTYGRTLAQTAGTLMMRAADADVLPFDFTVLAATLQGYDDELKGLLHSVTAQAETRQRNLDAGYYKLMVDPGRPEQAPDALLIPPSMDFSALDSSIADLTKAAAGVQQAAARWNDLPVERKKALNERLTQAERKLSSDEGLPRRPWVRNLLYAPGTLTGYGAKTIPGVREALEQNRFPEAKQQLALVSRAIEDEARYLAQIVSDF